MVLTLPNCIEIAAHIDHIAAINQPLHFFTFILLVLCLWFNETYSSGSLRRIEINWLWNILNKILFGYNFHSTVNAAKKTPNWIWKIRFHWRTTRLFHFDYQQRWRENGSNWIELKFPPKDWLKWINESKCRVMSSYLQPSCTFQHFRAEDRATGVQHFDHWLQSNTEEGQWGSGSGSG